MGLRDEELRERQIIDGDEASIYPGQVTATELETEGIEAKNVDEGVITSVMMAATCRDATKGLTGLAGATGLTLVPDGTNLELDAGVTPAKKVQIADDGVDVDAVAALSSGGLTGGAGSAFAVNPDGSTCEISGGKVRLKDAGITKAKKANDAKHKLISVNLSALSAGVTVTDPIFTCPEGKSYVVESIEIGAQTAPTDANGTITADVIKYDVDAGPAADVNVVAAADIKLAAAKTGQALTVITAANANVLSEHDSLRIESTANDEGADGIDANWVAPILTLVLREV